MATRFPVDISLFDQTAHTPSLFTLERSMGLDTREILDYCIPVNSHFPCPEMMERLQKGFRRAIRYYPASNDQIARTVGHCFALDPDCVVMFNGATELLTWIDQVLIQSPVILPIPTFGRWTDVPRGSQRELVFYQRTPADSFEIDVDRLVLDTRKANAQTLVLCNPNNPTGACLDRASLVRLLDALTDLPLIVIDESFLDFSDLVPSPSVADLAMQRKNLVVMKSLGKNLGLHGVRLGYSVSHPETAAKLRAIVPHWNINAVAEMVLNVLPDYLSEYQDSRRRVISDRRYLEHRLQQISCLDVFPAQSNFVFCRLQSELNGDTLRRRLLTEHGCLIRHCGNKIGSDRNHLRIVARSRRDTDALISAMSVLYGRRTEAACVS